MLTANYNFLPLFLQPLQFLPYHPTLTIHAQHDIIETLSRAIDIDEGFADLLLDEIIGDEVIEKDIGESSEIFDRHIDIELHAFEAVSYTHLTLPTSDLV